MNKISDVIICVECKKILNSPILLPCGHSMCQHHISQGHNFIMWTECGVEHSSHLGFAPNKGLERIINAQIEEFDLLRSQKQALELCQKLDDTIAFAKTSPDDPIRFVHSRIEDLKNKVDTNKEVIIHKVGDLSDMLKASLELYKRECENRAESDRAKKYSKKLEFDLEKCKQNANNYRAKLIRFKGDKAEIRDIQCALDRSIEGLQSQLESFGTLLMNNFRF